MHEEKCFYWNNNLGRKIYTPENHGGFCKEYQCLNNKPHNPIRIQILMIKNIKSMLIYFL